MGLFCKVLHLQILTVATILLTAAAESSSPFGCSTNVMPRYLRLNSTPSSSVSRVSVQFSGSSNEARKRTLGSQTHKKSLLGGRCILLAGCNSDFTRCWWSVTDLSWHRLQPGVTQAGEEPRRAAWEPQGCRQEPPGWMHTNRLHRRQRAKTDRCRPANNAHASCDAAPRGRRAAAVSESRSLQLRCSAARPCGRPHGTAREGDPPHLAQPPARNPYKQEQGWEEPGSSPRRLPIGRSLQRRSSQPAEQPEPGGASDPKRRSLSPPPPHEPGAEPGPNPAGCGAGAKMGKGRKGRRREGAGRLSLWWRPPAQGGLVTLGLRSKARPAERSASIPPRHFGNFRCAPRVRGRGVRGRGGRHSAAA